MCSTTFVSATSPMCKCNSTTKHGTKMRTAIPGLAQILYPWEKNHRGHAAHIQEATHCAHSFKSHETKLIRQHCKENWIQTRSKSNLLLVKDKWWTHSKIYTKDVSDDIIYSGSAAGKCRAHRCPVHAPHSWESLGWLQPCHGSGPYLLPKSKRYLFKSRNKCI